MKQTTLIFFLIASLHGIGQVPFSIATDVTLLRNFSPKQKFWAFGQTIQSEFHFGKKDGAYARLGYFSTGKFNNNFVATAKSPTSTPASFVYNVGGAWKSNQFSLGWKHYVKGSSDAEDGWSLYGGAGFGLMFVHVTNSLSRGVDTSLYDTHAAPIAGTNKFNRLTLDLCLGMEIPLSGNMFVYGDLRTWLRSSNYPSAYLHSNKNVPLPLTLSVGVRVLFAPDDY